MGELIKSALVVEDAIELGEIVVATLERLGMECRHAIDGEQALEIYREFDPDLIILDIGLPGMNGWQLLDEIKKEVGGKLPLPVIVITAFTDPANRLIGTLQNVNSYIMKPLTTAQIEEAVKKIRHPAG